MSQSQNNNSNLLFASLSLFCLGLADNVRGPLFPELLRVWQIEKAVGSAFFGVASGCAILAGLISGALLGRIGYVAGFRLGLLLLGVSQFVFAFVPLFSGVLFGAVLMGLGLGLLGVVQNVLVLINGDQSRQQKNSSALHSTYAGASLLAPGLVGLTTVILGLPAKWVFVICGLACLLLVAYSLGRTGQFATPTSYKTEKHDWLALFKIPAEAHLLVWVLALYVGAEILVGTRLGVLATELYGGQDLSAPSVLTGAFFVGLFIGRVAYIFWSPRMNITHQLLLCLFGAGGLTLLGLLWHPWAFALVGIAMAPTYPLAMALAGKWFAPEIERFTQAAIVMIGVAVVSLHFLFGVLSQAFQVSKAFYVVPGLVILSLLLLVVLMRRMHARPQH